MNTAAAPASLAKSRTGLRLHVPTAEEPSSSRWLINGYPAMVLTWTAEEWDHLTEQPMDAQECPNGVWCALRMD